MNNEIGIYIHIPFCISKCYYCDFASFENKEEKIESYVYAVCREILQNAEILSQYRVTSIYIGGGTPSYIDEKYIKQILDTLFLVIDKESVVETTIELNPNSVTLEKLRTYKEAGINRLSIGLQTIYDEILKKIGRVHKVADFEKTLEIANKLGYDNISLDLIYPLPDLDLKKIKQTIDYVVKLKSRNIKHISIYNLEIHPNTKLSFLLNEGYISLAGEDEEYEMYKYIKDKLEASGFHRYEISNYSIPGYESKHNLKYWSQEQYLGFGSNASSFFCGSRYTNVRSIEEYIKAIEENGDVIDRKSYESLDLLALMKEYIMLALRKTDGLDISKFKLKYKKDIYDIFNQEFKELEANGLIKKEDNNIKLTNRGLEVANLVWEKFV